MKRLITFVVAMMCVGALAQSRRLQGPYVPPPSALDFTPTNLPGGLSASGWWEPSRSYTTNGSVGTLPNLTSIGAGFNLTNGSATPIPPLRQVAAQNGLDTLFFNDGANNFLLCTSYTSSQPHEVFMVLSITNAASATFVFGGVNGGAQYHRLEHNQAAEKKFRLGGGGVADSVVALDLTNQFFVLDIVWSNLSSTIYTNNSLALVVNGGSAAAGGITLGAHNGASKPRFSFFGMNSFTGQVLNATDRSNNWYYWKTRAGIP